MARYYIIDITKKVGNKNPVVIFDNIPATIEYLGGMCLRQFKMTRGQYMTNTESLGFGGDEQTGRAFYEQMEQYFTIGIIRGDSTPIKCNIFEAVRFHKEKEGYGD